MASCAFSAQLFGVGKLLQMINQVTLLVIMCIRVAFKISTWYNTLLQLKFTSRQTQQRWLNLVANGNPDFKIKLWIKHQKSTSKLPASQCIKHIQLVNTSVKLQHMPRSLSVTTVSCQQISPSKREKRLKKNLKYPKIVYVALIKYGLSQCVSVQCTNFQRARNSCMKASSFRDFSSVEGQSKMPQDKLY